MDVIVVTKGSVGAITKGYKRPNHCTGFHSNQGLRALNRLHLERFLTLHTRKMASTLSRALPRLVSSLHTTPILRRPRSHKALARTITSFHGLQGLAQPWRVPTEEAPELVESGELALHLEALQRWHDEAELLREVRVLPPGVDDQINLEAETRGQVKDLMESLIEEEILDFRRGWVLASNF
ncbi:uncharacterized protein [Penaeus vannamei]|uniref:uncharacterized protein isoform X1 n=1 Tax=Penaeus vannamei TaxID=6689 RepID=UPI00387F4A4B